MRLWKSFRALVLLAWTHGEFMFICDYYLRICVEASASRFVVCMMCTLNMSKKTSGRNDPVNSSQLLPPIITCVPSLLVFRHYIKTFLFYYYSYSWYSCSWNTISQLRSVTCHMGSHSVTSHPTQVSTPAFTPASQAGTRFTYSGGMEG